MKKGIWAIVLLVILIMAGFSGAQVASGKVDPASLPAEGFLFCSFRGNGENGLHLAWSTDGLKWTALQDDKSYLTSSAGGKLMRDPNILLGPDGEFRMVWSSGWYERTIGYAHSKDLIHWSEPRAIPVMDAEPTARNSWAPELAWDAGKKQYVIFWASTIPGRFPETDQSGDGGLNHRVYCTTTTDFETFTPTRLFFNPGFSVIDSTIFQDAGKIYLVFKDETKTPVKKHLQVATGESVEGPFGDIQPTFTKDWVEGPSLLRVGDWIYCYFDMYRDHKYGLMRTKDMKAWEDITPQLQFSVRDVRHGTAFKVSREVLANLLNSPAPTTKNAE